MSIPDEFKQRCIYHFTHVGNLSNILKNGLLSTSEKNRLGLTHVDIAISEIQNRRSCMQVTCGSGGVVHDYVPFYFCKRSTMLLSIVRNKIADQQLIIYFEFPIDIVNKYDYVFSDASANTAKPPNFYSKPSDLFRLNWDAIDSLKWRMQSELLKQARMAELLIYKRVEPDDIGRIIVWNDTIKKIVQKCYKKEEKPLPIVGFDSIHYFTDFYDTQTKSIVTGPYLIRKNYENTVSFILEYKGKAANPKFRRLGHFRKALRNDFAIIPETEELVGLETDNEVHTDDVGKHTLKVVDVLRELTEFHEMESIDQLVTEVAAYLHDIGKGPKTRWEFNGGKQKVDPDHPIKALPMLEDILTEYIEIVSDRSATLICKLVCYHDLIGDIIGKGRRIEELIEIVADKRELNMLIAIGKADMISIYPGWVHEYEIEQIKSTVIKNLV